MALHQTNHYEMHRYNHYYIIATHSTHITFTTTSTSLSVALTERCRYFALE
jgi:hypothetical protein